MLQYEGPKSKIWITDSGKLNLKPEDTRGPVIK